MRRTTTALLAVALTGGIGLASAGSASAIGLDDAFGVNGVSLTPTHASGGGSERYQSLTAGPGGGSYQSGFTTLTTSAIPTDRAVIVSRLDAAGQLVPSFGTGGADGSGVVTVNLNAGPFLPGPGGATASTGNAENSRGLAMQSDGKVVVAAQSDTPQSLAKPDMRDRDVYVFRLNLDGTLDTSFNSGAVSPDVPGILRVDMSNGVRPAGGATTVNPDAVYGVRIQPDGKIIVEATKGTDSSEPTRAVRPWAILRINTNGTLDTTWGASSNGIALSPTATNAAGAPADLNERQPLIQPDGKVVAAGYTEGSIPHLARFTSAGLIDPTFGVGGLTSNAEGLAVGASAEVYDTAYQNGNIVMVGYGRRTGAAAGIVDALLYRFTSTGQFDTTWGPAGSGGLIAYDRAGGQDRFRELTSLPDGRLVPIGLSSSTPATPGPEVIDGLMAVVKADGTFDTSFGNGGVLPIDLGGTTDGLLGSATVANGTRVVAGGFLGAASAVNDVPAVTRIDVTPAVAGPPGADGDDGAPGTNGTNGSNGANGANGAQGPAGPGGAAGPVGPAGPKGATGPKGAKGSAASIKVTCKLVPPRRRTITCSVKPVSTSRGAIRLKLTRAGRTVASGQAMGRGKSALVRLKGAVRAGRKYTLTTTLPAGPRTRSKVVTQITLR